LAVSKGRALVGMPSAVVAEGEAWGQVPVVVRREVENGRRDAFECSDLRIREFDFQGGQVLAELIEAPRTDKGQDDPRTALDPGERRVRSVASPFRASAVIGLVLQLKSCSGRDLEPPFG
jgi:hypothetical protein